MKPVHEEASASAALRRTRTFREGTMGIFVPNKTNCHLCGRAIEALAETVSFPILLGSRIAEELSDGFAHRTCTLAHPLVDNIRTAWSNHWQEQASVFDAAAAILDHAIAFHKRNRVIIVSNEYLFVIEEMKSAEKQLVKFLGDTHPTPAEHDFPLSSYSLTRAGTKIVFFITTRTRRPSPHDPSATIEEEMALLELRLVPEAWQELSTSLRLAVGALP